MPYKFTNETRVFLLSHACILIQNLFSVENLPLELLFKPLGGYNRVTLSVKG